ncbi:lamin tail domain-containing protein [Patescibacteria group bacterium]|nr:lamin tail domain-containing protein [Patescibacteria group bacterium]
MKRLLFIFLIFSLVSPALAAIPDECLPYLESNEPQEISESLKLDSLYPNPQDGEEEWIKIKNTGPDTLDLSNYTIEDETQKPWTMSGQIQSSETSQIEGFPFQLNNGSETVTLKTIEGTFLDSISYSSSIAGQIITHESPTETEETPQTTLTTPELYPTFSEALPNPEGSDSTDEWIELFNPYDSILILDGLKLDDAEGGSTAHPLNGTLEPESFLLLWVEDSKLTLNNTTDSIRLLGAQNEVLWEIPYENPKEGESLANFGDYIDWTTSPTPGDENIVTIAEEESTESENSNGNLSENIEISEVFPNPEGPDQDGEWIELTNGSDVPVNLGNWIIDDGEGGSAPYIIPDDTVIGPGETLVIERSESSIALNNSNESVVLSDYTGEIMDQISYESTEEGMSYSLIEIEEMNSEQAGLSELGARIFSTWEWVLPTPGENNPTWKQFKGTVVDFDGLYVTLYDGISNWTLQTAEENTDELFFQPGNKVLARVSIQNDIYRIQYSELLESFVSKTSHKIPYNWILIGCFASTYFGYEMYKKYKKNSVLPSNPLPS